MRIGIYTESFYYRIWGGSNRVVRELVTRLARLDSENTYVLFNTCGHTDSSAFGIEQKNFQTVAIPGGRRPRWLMWALLNAPKVERWTGPLDVVHSPFHFPPSSHAPLVLTILDTIILQEPSMFTPQLRAVNHLTFHRAKSAAALACISDSTRQDIAKVLRLPDEKLKVVHIGVDERFSPAPGSPDEAGRVKAKLGIRGEYFLNLGIIQPRKNQQRLIGAYEKFRAARPNDKTQLVIGGQQGWITGEFESRLAGSPLRGDIITPGRLDDEDVPVLMRNARAFVFPTLLEGFGLPALEAMASGTPLAASDIPPLREVAGDCAFYFNPLDEDSMAAALIAAVAGSPDNIEKISRGIARAKERRFTWDNMAVKYLEIYTQAARSRSASPSK